MKRIVLISCASKKLKHKSKAEDLYISTLFSYSLKFAKQLNTDEIHILSAKHGLLDLKDVIEPYDLTLNNMNTIELKRWADSVLEQLKAKYDFNNLRVTFLAGNNYRKYLIKELKNYNIPFEGLRIGKQLQKLKELTS